MTVKRPPGRGLFYSRDSGGEHEMTPGEYVLWAAREARKYGVIFDGTPARIEQLIRSNESHLGDLFFDNRIAGNLLARRGLSSVWIYSPWPPPSVR